MVRSPSPRRHNEKRDRDRRRIRSPPSSLRRQHTSPRRRNPRTRSRSPQQHQANQANQAIQAKQATTARPAVTQEDLEGKTPEEQEMISMMGFSGFDSTKGKKVDNNEAGEVQVVLKRKYRQYMNRKGGFNRPLDFVV